MMRFNPRSFARKSLCSFALACGRVAAVSLLATAVAGVHAQAPAKGIDDTWQGTLHIPQRDLRLVVKVAKDDKGVLKATMYSIDQGAGSIGASTTTFQDGTLKFEIKPLEISYDGTLAADGKTITGTFTQNDKPMPLVLERATPATAWTIPEAPKPVPPMPADAKPVFEVATVKPSNPDQKGMGFTYRGGHFMTINTTLEDILKFCYGLQSKQLEGLPEWAKTEKWDVNGQPDLPGMPNVQQTEAMMQLLVNERFGLKFHEDKKEMPAYVLSVAKGGPKLEAAAADAGSLPGLFFRGLGLLTVQNATMKNFTELMQQAVLDRPVVDQTGLTGKYNFTLKWTPDESQFSGLASQMPKPTETDNPPPPLYTAITEQVGLKLDAMKAPVKVMVIDHVEKPSAN